MKLNRIVATSAVTLAFVSFATAQQEGVPPVAEEMAMLDIMVGNWEGAGVVRMAPGEPEMSWTSVSTAELVLDGHFMTDSMKIEVEGLPVPMIFHSLNGWDNARQRFVSFGVGNTGEAMETTMRFAGNKVITVGGGMEDGHVVSDHWVTEYDGDEMRFIGHRSVDGGPFFVHVEGRATRGGDGCTVGPESADYAMSPPNEHLKGLAPTIGTWNVTGEWKPMANTEPMMITGQDVTEAIVGGHALRTTTKGQGGSMRYEAMSFMTWSAEENCLVSVGCDNMGEYHMAKCWVTGDTAVMVTAGAMQGMPMANRSTLEMSANEMKWTGHASLGTDAPYEAFTGTLTRVDR
ncbi:MAG: DUF1579 family protein [Planctomycetota bacterium]|jgi:hypothetical protein